MRRIGKIQRGLSAAVVTTGIWAVAAAGAEYPQASESGPIQQVAQQPAPPVAPPSTGTQPAPGTQPPPPTQPPDTGASPGGSQTPNPLAGAGLLPPSPTPGTDTGSRLGDGGASGTVGQATSVNTAGGQTASTLNAPDVGDLLARSAQATGVEVQRRNALSTDPRVRGYRVGQLVTMGDGAFFFPARQDIDTAISKFDPSSVRDVIIFRGPYTATRGPGFSFLDVATFDSPRFDTGYEAHGRSSLGYQTNGARWDGLQTIFGGGPDWGFRVTANLLQGNDYIDGTRMPIAASYNATNINYAIGMDLNPGLHFEFKGLRVNQHDVEFPGLYFDIEELNTEAYSWRFTIDKQQWFDRSNMEIWYNTTVANGNTQQFNKQQFVRTLLATSFNTNNNPLGINQFEDFSTTRFGNKSYGYRWAMQWGEQDGMNLVAGADLNVIGQGLLENIQFTQTQGINPNTGFPVIPGGQPTFNQVQKIPNSSMTDPGFFAEYTMPISDRLKMKSGGRVDIVNTGSESRVIYGNIDFFGPPGTPGSMLDRGSFDPIIFSVKPWDNDLGRQFTLFNGFLSSEYKVDQNWTALSAFGYAERAPTLTELYAAGPFVGVLQQGTLRLIGDPNLEKEQLTQLDVGLKGDYGKWVGGVNGFYAFVHNYITFDRNKQGPGISQVIFTNTDQATLAGGEMFGQYDLLDWLTPFGTMSYVQGEDRTHIDNRRLPYLTSSRRVNPATGEQAAAVEALPQIPPLEFRSGFRIHEAKRNPKWQIEFAARSVMGQNNIATSLGEYATAGFTIFDIRTYWQATDKLLFTAGVENLNDKQYREHLDPISGNILGVDPLYRPGTNFYFTTQLTY